MIEEKNNFKFRISIITVCYNSEKTIEYTIRSVLDQNFDGLQYIIVDGKSTDKTIEIIEYYKPQIERKMNFMFISEPDSGIYDAMNKGIRMAEGRLIGIINSDDWYENGCFNEVWQMFKNNNYEDLIVYGLLKIIREDKIEILERDHNELKTKGMIGHPTCFVANNVYKQIGVFDTRFTIVADYDFILRAYEKGVRFIRSNNILANFRGGGASEKDGIVHGKELLLMKYKHGYISKSRYMYKNAVYPIEQFIKKVPKRPSTIWKLCIKPLFSKMGKG